MLYGIERLNRDEERSRLLGCACQVSLEKFSWFAGSLSVSGSYAQDGACIVEIMYMYICRLCSFVVPWKWEVPTE